MRTLPKMFGSVDSQQVRAAMLWLECSLALSAVIILSKMLVVAESPEVAATFSKKNVAQQVLVTQWRPG